MINKEGWNILEINTYGSDNNIKAYSAGYLEGYISYLLINNHYKNIVSSIYNNKPLADKTKQFVYDQWTYFEKMVKNQNSQELSCYQETLALIYYQYKGLYQGYIDRMKDKTTPPISEEDFYIITMQADLEDIVPATTSSEVKFINLF
jgi:hypothetical protein